MRDAAGTAWLRLLFLVTGMTMALRLTVPVLVALITAVGACLIGPAPVAAATPIQTQAFRSTSGRTVIEYYEYNAGPCGTGASCNFRGLVRVPSGFDQVEVFLAGFTLETLKSVDTVRRISAAAQKFRYDASTGDLDLGLSATFATRTAQPYTYRTTFVVVLTGSTVARFTPISTGCVGVAQCRIVRTLPTAVPAGMHYIGFATSTWDLGSNSGPIAINALSVHQDGLIVSPPSVNIEYACALQDARKQNRMFCEWAAKVIAFDPAEMGQNGSGIFPQYTMLGWNTPFRAGGMSQSPNPSGSPIAGFLDAFEGLTLMYPAKVEHPIWLIEASARHFMVSQAMPMTALTEYGIFLGTKVGNRTGAQPFGYQLSRAFGFLR